MVLTESSRWRGRPLLWSGIILIVLIFLLLSAWHTRGPKPQLHNHEYNDHKNTYGSVLVESPIPCDGARGLGLDFSADDRVHEFVIDGDVPQPYVGSFADLGLEHTWSDRQSRYGPYGFGDDSPSNTRSRIFWDKLDWAKIQNACLERNLRPGLTPGSVPLISSRRRMTMPTWADGGHWIGSRRTPARPKRTSGRTAIILRSYNEYFYKEEDKLSLRSLITETALQYSARYAVFILVDVHGNHDILRNTTEYQKVMNRIPEEFRNMAVLYDQKSVLKSWYPRILEWRPEYQMEQPRQLFAHLFPEFDHYWQIEMDVRFMGNAGKLINAIEEFARNEPRKQSRERSSFSFTPAVYGTYANFTSLVDQALEGGSSFWPGAILPDIKPVGPPPPTNRPEDDAFEWGVGEEADLILLSATMNITLTKGWGKYREWIYNFKLGLDTPRMASAPCVSRTSWNLLNAMHEAQVWDGKRLHSEATPPSFALWHGLKISHPPMPVYGIYTPQYTANDIDMHLNGGPPDPAHDGMAWGIAYGNQFKHQTGAMELGTTWSFTKDIPTHLYRVWLEGDPEAVAIVDKDWPIPLVRDNRVLMPNIMIHAVKNQPPPKNP